MVAPTRALDADPRLDPKVEVPVPSPDPAVARGVGPGRGSVRRAGTDDPVAAVPRMAAVPRVAAGPVAAVQPAPVDQPEAATALAVLDTMPVGVLVELPDGAGWANAHLRRLWGREDGSRLMVRELRDMLEPVGPRAGTALSRPVPWPGPARRGRSWTRHVLRRPDGTSVRVQTARALVATPSSSGPSEATFVMEDIPRAPDARLRRAFLAMVGHELRTPITSIVAGAEMLHLGALHDGDRQEVSRLVVEEANRLHVLVEQLTALTILQSAESPLRSEPVHIVNLVRRVGEREARRRPGVDLRLPDRGTVVAPALGDEDFIAQVLTALIDNAAKYSDPGSRVELRVTAGADNIEVHVLDRGRGLPPGDPDQLFELFHRGAAHPHGPSGSGVGLYVAREVMRALGGRVWARPRRRGGADVGFALPIAR